MSNEIKSGKEVIDEFFAEIHQVENVDKKIVDALVSLHDQGKFTDKNIQNAMESLLQEELDKTDNEDDQD